MTARVLTLVLAVALALLATGCIFKSSTLQASSESSSGSSASSSSSSRSSSGPSAYTRDVKTYTTEWVLSGGDVEAFRRGLGEIAKRRGITDWENDQQTYDGIGRGLKKSGVSGTRLNQLKAQLAGPNPQAGSWIQQGYDSESAED
jgi:hypothetical protein